MCIITSAVCITFNGLIAILSGISRCGYVSHAYTQGVYSNRERKKSGGDLDDGSKLWRRRRRNAIGFISPMMQSQCPKSIGLYTTHSNSISCVLKFAYVCWNCSYHLLK